LLKETLIETIRAIVAATEKAYGDDYIQPASRTCEIVDDIDAALNLLSFDLEFDKVDLNAEIIDEDNDESGNYYYDIKFEEESLKDEYEFDEVDPEVFKDATQMLIWLKKMKQQYRMWGLINYEKINFQHIKIWTLSSFSTENIMIS